jgi:hypothetical protein
MGSALTRESSIETEREIHLRNEERRGGEGLTPPVLLARERTGETRRRKAVGLRLARGGYTPACWSEEGRRRWRRGGGGGGGVDFESPAPLLEGGGRWPARPYSSFSKTHSTGLFWAGLPPGLQHYPHAS